MERRIWIAEGYASDGEVYGRSLQIPGKEAGAAPVSSGVERKQAIVIKANLGDIPSCPCISAAMPSK
ncbi:hypothetical protein EZI54_06110 [Marinobacter halodurans]|uniref:Uncharacterized protein n=1 Tax=Marinobacter halodurans TaxID=2528979 RepID=A0ABY1ZMY1_9GAMM|nr:hypothetical protein EZI54_06110 [Marinobacter halodurans]